MKTAMSVPSWRRTVGVMLLATVVALAVVVAIGASANKASAQTRVITRSFSNSQLILIPEGAPTDTAGAALPYPSTILPTFPAGTRVLDVNVVLRNYSHTFPDDVDVLLKHRGTNITIMSDVGGSTDVNNQTFQLDDEAGNGHLPDGGPLVGGAFQPTNAEGGDTFDFPAPNPASANSSLSSFDGLLAGGGWKLFVDDNAATDVGRIGGGWTVRIRASVPE